jgi:hypothetical protein
VTTSRPGVIHEHSRRRHLVEHEYPRPSVSRTAFRLVVLVAAVIFATVAIVFFVWHRSSSAEDRVRQQAKDLACNISQVGLGSRPCAPVENLRKTGSETWRFRIEGPARGRYRCYELRLADQLQPPTQLSCR